MSEIPVVSAVGHETDFTLCDFAADLRAPTPSAAAELCTPDREEEAERLASFAYTLRRAMEMRISDGRQGVDALTRAASLYSPQRRLETETHRLERLDARLQNTLASRLQKEQGKLGEAAARLDALSPLKVFARGYAAVYNTDREKSVTAVADAAPGETLRIRLSDGALRCIVEDTNG